MERGRTRLDIVTPVVVRELFNGDEVAFPVADPTHVSYGTRGESVLEQRLFLKEHLERATAETIARFALPDATSLEVIEVPLGRDDLPERERLEHPVSIPCAVIPAGRDRWAIALPLSHTLYVEKKETLEAVVRHEVRRIVQARQLSSWEFLALLPARRTWLETLDLQLDLGASPSGRAESLRKKITERIQRKQAARVIESVAMPLARLGQRHFAPLVGRDPELRMLTALLGGTDRLGVVLVGPELVGKSALLHAWLDSTRGKGKKGRIAYATSGAQLIAGMSGLGQWQERVRRVMEAAEHLDAVIYFDHFGDLFADRPGHGVDLASAMKPWLEQGRVRIVGELTPEGLDHYKRRHGAFLGNLTPVRLEAMTAIQSRDVLETRISTVREREPGTTNLADDAVQTVIDLLERYEPYRAFPGKAVAFYDELRSIFEVQRADRKAEPVRKRDVFEVFSLQTGVPTFLLRDDAALKLEDVKAALGKRLIGQNEAVRRVAETVCVVKANLQPADKPLANFLFVGPTGVGKTELARTLARYLFGSEERMIRFDMSEYMDPLAADRLIRGTDSQDGLLTRKVRQQPFCVLLLDEVEKAHSAVFDLLLQVLGEGRLTDARGKTAHFQNAIIIMTSNLGAAERRRGMGFEPADEDASAYYMSQVHKTFRPELVNRIDRVIPFAALTPDEIHAVARVVLERIQERRGFLEMGIQLAASDAAVAHLAQMGFSAEYGARALRRVLDDALVAPAAALMSRAGGDGRNASLWVRTQGEPAPAARDIERGKAGARIGHAKVHGLVLELRQGAVASGSKSLRTMHAILTLRRAAADLLALPEWEQVTEQIAFLLTQLNYGKPAASEGRSFEEMGALRADYTRLERISSRVQRAWSDLQFVEDYALANLFSGEPLDAALEEAEVAHADFERSFAPVLVWQEPGAHQISLFLQELGNARALSLYAKPLVEDCARRRWSCVGYVDQSPTTAKSRWKNEEAHNAVRELLRRGEKIAAIKLYRERTGAALKEAKKAVESMTVGRWGLPLSTEEMLAALDAPSRPFREMRLDIQGPYAGAFLALEAGLHRWHGLSSGPPVHMGCQVLETQHRPAVGFWASDTAARMPAIREWQVDRGELFLIGRVRKIKLSPADYWPNLEKIALVHLLALRGLSPPETTP